MGDRDFGSETVPSERQSLDSLRYTNLKTRSNCRTLLGTSLDTTGQDIASRGRGGVSRVRPSCSLQILPRPSPVSSKRLFVSLRLRVGRGDFN